MSFIDGILNYLRPSADATTGYEEASEKLKKFNQPLIDRSTVKILDTNSQSFLKDFRDMMDDLRKVKFLDRDEYLGIAITNPVKTLDGSYKIYVDIPGISIENITALEDVTQEFLAAHEYKAFYPISDNVAKLEMPSYGAIVRVKPSKEYFSTDISRPYENKYLGIYRSGEIVQVGEGTQQSPAPILNAAFGSNSAREGAIGDYSSSPDTSGETPAAISKKNRYASGQTIQSYLRVDDTGDGKENVEFCFPLIRMIKTSNYGYRKPFNLGNGKVSSEWHMGIDLVAPMRTPTYAIANGNAFYVASDRTDNGKGLNIAIDHGKGLIKNNPDVNLISGYYHLDSATISQGQPVTKGQLIGYSGQTPQAPYLLPHAHLQIYTFFPNGAAGFTDKDRHIAVYPDSKKFENCYFYNPEQFYNVQFEIGNSAELNNFIKEEQRKNNEKLAKEREQAQSEEGGVSCSSPSALESSPDKGSAGSMPINRPKMLIANFNTDLSSGVIQSNKRGSTSIKIREDILPDLIKIKNILNKYNIPLCCEKIDINIKNNISLMAKLGLEIKLNPYSAMTGNNNILLDDYFVGPDYLQPIGMGYKLKVYGNVKRNISYFDEFYSIQRSTIDVYTGKFIENAPEIKKILVNYIDLTKIFEDYGFIHADPQQSFFNNSNLLASKWFIFYKPSKFTIGYTYKEALATIYNKNGEHIWNLPEIKWDGERFI
jgi:murein DD-endopeptidase MepM/ murein hydrolase activator NlpD